VHNAVAVAEADRDGEVRYLGTFDNTPDAVVRLLRKLAGRYEALHFCCEAGSTGHGLYRQILPYDGVKTTVFAPKLNRRNYRSPLCVTAKGRRDRGKESLTEIGRSYNVNAATISRLGS
jgi:hypothetical protein